MTTVWDIYRAVDRIAPFSTAESYDNVGVLVGDETREVSKALLALDVTHAVIDEAERTGAELIITHHPVIFDPVKRLPAAGYLYRLCQNGLTVLSAHTNLDRAERGVSRALAEKLGLCGIAAPEEGEGFLLLGELTPSRSAAEFSALVREKLSAPFTRVYDGGKPIQKVAVCSGSGASMLPLASALGADALVTGDVKHDRVVAAAEMGLTLIDAGHYETERVILPVLREYLAGEFPDVRFTVADSCQPLFV